MKKYTQTIFALLLCFCSLQSSSAQGEWRLRKSADGIEIYSKKMEGSSFEAFKGITRITTTVNSLAAVLYDVGTFSEWMYLTPKAELVARENKSTQIHYTITDSPWPVADRDAVFRFQYKYDPDDGSLTVLMDAVPEEFPEKEGLIRIEASQGMWKFTPEDHGLVRVEYELHADPNGNIPGWLANSAVVDTPFKTLTAMKKQVKKERYQGRTFSFMKNN